MVNPGHDVPVTIRRGGETIQLKMPVASVEIQNEKIGEGGLEPFLGPNTKLVVAVLSPGMPGEQAGLKVGDQIVAVNGMPVEAGMDPSAASATAPANVLHGQFDVIREIRTSNGQPITLTVKRGDETLPITTTPKLEDGIPKIGFLPSPKDADKKEEPLSPVAALKHGVNENIRIIQLTKAALAQVFTGKRSAGETVAGPVGIAAIVGQAAEQGATPVFRLMGMLSLNLGIFNLLPIPVLDGGLIFMILLEGLLGVFGLPLTMRIKERMMQVGMVMLMLLMGFVIFNDISKQFSKRSAPQTVEQPKDSDK
jgi:regulator of sigma E protease